MNKDQQIQAIAQMMNGLLEQEPAYFLVEITIKPTNNIKVFLDSDTGVVIEKCVAFNRQLYKLIEESELYPAGDFSLEVSSPGLEEPLQLHRQYSPPHHLYSNHLKLSYLEIEHILVIDCR